jgi:hypothetical protein
MTPESLIMNLPAMALQLYAYLDLKQGDRGWPAKGYRKIGKVLGWKHDSVREWAMYLADLGIIDITGDGHQSRALWVIHNPARGRSIPRAKLPALASEQTPRPVLSSPDSGPRKGPAVAHQTGQSRM